MSYAARADLTQEEQAKILTWAGVWPAEPHWTIMPALEGDFADVVAMKCLRKLSDGDFELSCDIDGWFAIAYPYPPEPNETVSDPAQAIFAAVLAYLEQEE